MAMRRHALPLQVLPYESQQACGSCGHLPHAQQHLRRELIEAFVAQSLRRDSLDIQRHVLECLCSLTAVRAAELQGTLGAATLDLGQQALDLRSALKRRTFSCRIL